MELNAWSLNHVEVEVDCCCLSQRCALALNS